MTDPGKAVFLSYASQDAGAAQRLCEVLRNAGVEVWFDQGELRGGDSWDASIRQQIKSCYLFVPMISANTQAREEGYFRREWKLAVDRTSDMAGDRAFLLPVVMDGTSDVEARVPALMDECEVTYSSDVARAAAQFFLWRRYATKLGIATVGSLLICRHCSQCRSDQGITRARS